MTMSMQEIVSKLTRSENLDPEEMSLALRAIINGACDTPLIESFLIALRVKGETVEEIAAAAKVMRLFAEPLPRTFEDLLDTCGTGGDAKNTLNVSTLSAIVGCAAGARVAKHGNRSVSSVCGSADLLELLGIKIDLSPEQVAACLEKTGFGFMFAPRFHPSVKHATAARKNLGGKTIFNLLGPLSNPASAPYQLIGVYSDGLVEPLARALQALGVERALVVHGSDGMDEITLCAATQTAQVIGGQIFRDVLDPQDFGMTRASAESLSCATPADNLAAAVSVLNGQPGPFLEIVCLNAGAALWVAKKAQTIEQGIDKAREAVTSGRAKAKLEQIREFTRKS